MERKYSELTSDVERSIQRAYDLSLSSNDMNEVKGHLAYMLAKLREPNTLVQPVKDALAFVHTQEMKNQSWREWLVKPVLVALVTALITAPVSFYVGSTDRTKVPDCQPNTTTISTQPGITSQSGGPANASR